MITIDTPTDNSISAPGTSVPVGGTNGTPVRCKVTVGSSTNTYPVGTGPGTLPLTTTPDGRWGFSAPLPNATGSCVIMVISQNDKDDSVTINLQGPIPGGGGTGGGQQQ
jgi:hypothetical protein